MDKYSFKPDSTEIVGALDKTSIDNLKDMANMLRYKENDEYKNSPNAKQLKTILDNTLKSKQEQSASEKSCADKVSTVKAKKTVYYAMSGCSSKYDRVYSSVSGDGTGNYFYP